jgi:hypothetical protein
MNDTETYADAVAYLRRALDYMEADQSIWKYLKSRDAVLDRFKPTFSPENLPQLRQDEFHAFLLLENNKHWSGLHRHSPKMCADMDLLRSALTILLDESQPVEHRLDQATTRVTGMGKAVATAILLITHPDRYGVWNSTSEGGLKALDLWPRFERGASLGSRYVKINQTLNQLAHDLQTDLWALDMAWWHIDGVPGDDALVQSDVESIAVGVASETRGFPLEKHLQDFLWSNWGDTSLGQEWELYHEPGDPDLGYEYPCGIGRIDILARHKTKPDWLVVELKRGQTSDATVGQVLRYMGWIKKHLAEADEKVYGIIIAHEADDGLRYALSNLRNVDLQRYEVKFQLYPVPSPGDE